MHKPSDLKNGLETATGVAAEWFARCSYWTNFEDIALLGRL